MTTPPVTGTPRPDHRRRRVAVSLIAIVAVGTVLGLHRVAAHQRPPASTGAAAVPRACGTVSDLLVPSCGAWLGIWPRTRADGTMTRDLATNLTSVEDRLGRDIRLVSRYYGWGELPPDRTDERWRDDGRLLVIDLRARSFTTNRYVRWHDIAAGRHDTYLRAVALRIKAFRSKVFFSFNQEPEQELERGTGVAGTAADFAAAYRHIHDVFAEQQVTNAVWVWWVMGYLGHTAWYPSLYPGDRYVDWVSYDPYDYNACRHVPPKTPAQTVLPFLHWLAANRIGDGKPVMLSEFGSYGANRGGWYRGFGDLIKETPRIRAVIAFNSDPGTCDTRVTASTDTWQGFAALAGDPYFNPVAADPTITRTKHCVEGTCL